MAIDARHPGWFVAAMFTIIGGDGKEYGPATADQIRAWLTSGRANLDTQAKAVGSVEWRHLGDFAEFNAPASAEGASVPPPMPSMSMSSQMVGPVDSKAFADDLISRAAPLNIFGCLERSFELWKANFLPLVGVTALVILALSVAGAIPLIGMLSSFALNGVFYGGLYYYYLGRMRGQRREVGDAFAGFTKSFVPLMLTTLLTSAFSIAIMLLFFFPWVVFLIKVMMQPAGGIPPLPAGGIFLSILGLLVLTYISVSWAFAFALVIDKGLGPWTAMEVSRRVITKQWFRVFVVMLFGGILAMLGLIGLFIGIFLTVPLMFGAILYAYEDLCNPPVRDAVNPSIPAASPGQPW